MKKRLLPVAMTMIAAILGGPVVGQQIQQIRNLAPLMVQEQPQQPEQSEITEGDIGTVHWKYTDATTLEFSGTGALPDIRSQADIPEYFGRQKTITKVVIGDGIHTVGINALMGFEALTDVVFTENSTLTTIKQLGFAGDAALAVFNAPATLEKVEQDAFIETALLDNTVGPLYIGKTLVAWRGIEPEAVLTVRDDIKYIAGFAFAAYTPKGELTMNNNLKAVTLPAAVEEIGCAAFCFCPNLAEITIPENVKLIEDNAFTGCSGLATVTLKPVTPPTISALTFQQSNPAAKFVLPESPEAQAAYKAAPVWDNLLAEVISGQLTETANWELDKTTGTLNITGTGDMPQYTNSGNTPWGGYLSLLKTVNIGEGITSVGANTFHTNRALTEVNLPTSLRQINDYAFVNTAIKSIVIPDGVTKIGDEVFFNCQKLETVTLSATAALDFVGYNAFFMTPYEESLPEGLVILGNTAYKYVFGKTVPAELEIPAGVKYILPGLMIKYNEQYETVPVPEVTSVKLPESLLEIGQNAFVNLTSVREINMPASVTYIGNSVFHGCKKLLDIVMNGTTPPDIEEQTFSGLSKFLTFNVADPAAYNALPRWANLMVDEVSEAFDGVPSYTYIKSSRTLKITGVGNMIDYSDVRLLPWYEIAHKIVNIEIAEGVTGIGSLCFANTIALENVKIPDSVNRIGLLAFANSKLANDQAGKVVVIKDFAVGFGGEMPAETALEVPEGVKRFADFAFVKLVDGRLAVNPEIVSVKLPESLVEINYAAFNGAVNLKSVVIPANVTKIASMAFAECPLENLEVKAVTPPAIQDNSLPEYIDVVTVPEAARKAYEENPIWHDYVTDVLGESYATWEWTLTKSTGELNVSSLAEKQDMLVMDTYPWKKYQKKVKSVTVEPGFRTIAAYAFNNMYNAESATIASSVEEIGSSAFSNCSLLNNVVLHEGLTTIGDDAFAYCDRLEQLTLPESLVIVGSNAFGNTPFIANQPEGIAIFGQTLYGVKGGLADTKVVIPDGIVRINDFAFESSALTEVDMPESIDYIGEFAFANCTALKAVRIKCAGIPTACQSAFQGIAAGAKLYVHKDYLEKYWGIETWMPFAEILPLEENPDGPSVNVEANAAELTSVMTMNGAIVINVPQSMNYSIHTLSGQTVECGTAQGCITISDLPRGIYLVRLGNETHKIVM